MRLSLALPILALFMLGACVSREVLVPYAATAPPGVDFSGRWQIRAPERADEQRIDHLIQEMDGALRQGVGVVRTPPDDKRAGYVHVFLETGRRLKITQTPYGLFVSVDRSVVEEFRFGEQREVNVGRIVADRVSGWDGNVYVVETLDKNGVKLTERFWLSDDDVLHREITIRNTKKVESTVLQQFDRID
jgi:hypothetical protein